MEQQAFQDEMEEALSHCWVCGRNNPHGLHIKSYWRDDSSTTTGPTVAICTWQPQAQFISYPNVLSGGIISSLIDCHCINTAIAAAYSVEGHEIGSKSHVRYVTTSLQVTYLKPIPIDAPVILIATIEEMRSRKTVLSCIVSSGQQVKLGLMMLDTYWQYV